jgi:diguanylate cyclase (GGDEF)-like protein
MTRPASQPPPAAAPQTRVGAPPAASMTEALKRLQVSMEAVAVGAFLQGADPLQITARSDEAAHLLRDVWQQGGPGLIEQARGSQGAVGTNRLRARTDGPVCGKMLAVGLRDATRSIIGLLIVIRKAEQEKFGVRESELLTDFADQFSTLLSRTTLSAPGLLSWTDFQQRARAQERASGNVGTGCILYGDVDQLHVLNKLAGLAAGDQAIAAAAAALQDERWPEGAGACHISGDRFAVYLPKVSLAQARRVAEQLCRTVSERCANIGGLRTRMSISFGVASVPPGDPELTQALAAAEAACRAAKDRGRGRVEVYQEGDLSIIRRNDDVQIASSLRRALETERIGIVAQPLISLRGDASTEYHELLVRMVSETGSFVSPAHFMSAATRYQMLIDLDRTMLIRVFDRLRAARAHIASRKMRFSINLSGPTIGNPDFLEWLSSNVAPDSIPGEWLQFEITETAAVANVSQTQSMIRHLRARGVEFALDDFGTGVSSFAYLKAFDVSMLKLDGSFTRDLMTSARSESLVRGIAQLGQSMGIQTVAECVELETVRARLADLGIDRAQGFLFGQPVPFESILSPQPEHPGAPTPIPTDTGELADHLLNAGAATPAAGSEKASADDPDDAACDEADVG